MICSENLRRNAVNLSSLDREEDAELVQKGTEINPPSEIRCNGEKYDHVAQDRDNAAEIGPVFSKPVAPIHHGTSRRRFMSVLPAFPIWLPSYQLTADQRVQPSKFLFA